MRRSTASLARVVLAGILVSGALAGLSATAGATGSGWQVSTTYPPTPILISATSCPSSSICFGLGETGETEAFFTTTNNGSSWTAQTIGPLFEPQVPPLSLTCPTTTVCFDADEVTTDAGTHWTEFNIDNGRFSPTAFTCTSSTSCIEVGDDPPCPRQRPSPAPPIRAPPGPSSR